MNNQLIEKIITANNLPCPEFTYENPVLDKNVAKTLSKSFVKFLNLSYQNSIVNKNSRLSILECIRKMCQIEPEHHIKMDENLTSLLTEFYEYINKDSRLTESDAAAKSLDAFLIRNFKDMNITSSYISPLNPEVLQALINLNPSRKNLENLLEDTIHWNSTQPKTVRILKNLWTSDGALTSSDRLTTEDISIKLKPEIEKTILHICHSIMNKIDPNIDDTFSSDTSLKNLVHKSATSANCFQICCGVINYLFVMTNFDTKLQTFAQKFVKNVKENCTSNTYFSVLYPTHLSHLIVLLDIDIIDVTSLQGVYIKSTKKYLSELASKSSNDLILLLSHFPQWFDIYFS